MNAEAPPPKKKVSKWWWVAGGVVAIGVIGSLGNPPAQPGGNAIDAAATAPTPVPTPTPALKVTFAALVSAYQENELAAKKRFEGGPIEVTGKIASITSSMGDPTINFVGGRLNSARFADEAEDQLATLKSGEEVTVRCESLGEAISVLTLRGCVLVK